MYGWSVQSEEDMSIREFFAEYWWEHREFGTGFVRFFYGALLKPRVRLVRGRIRRELIIAFYGKATYERLVRLWLYRAERDLVQIRPYRTPMVSYLLFSVSPAIDHPNIHSGHLECAK